MGLLGSLWPSWALSRGQEEQIRRTGISSPAPRQTWISEILSILPNPQRSYGFVRVVRDDGGCPLHVYLSHECVCVACLSTLPVRSLLAVFSVLS